MAVSSMTVAGQTSLQGSHRLASKARSRDIIQRLDLTWMYPRLQQELGVKQFKSSQIPPRLWLSFEDLWNLYERKHGEIKGPSLEKLLNIIQSIGQVLCEVSDSFAEQFEITVVEEVDQPKSRSSSIPPDLQNETNGPAPNLVQNRKRKTNLQQETNKIRQMCIDAFEGISGSMTTINEIGDLAWSQGALNDITAWIHEPTDVLMRKMCIRKLEKVKNCHMQVTDSLAKAVLQWKYLERRLAAFHEGIEESKPCLSKQRKNAKATYDRHSRDLLESQKEVESLNNLIESYGKEAHDLIEKDEDLQKSENELRNEQRQLDTLMLQRLSFEADSTKLEQSQSRTNQLLERIEETVQARKNEQEEAANRSWQGTDTVTGVLNHGFVLATGLLRPNITQAELEEKQKLETKKREISEKRHALVEKLGDSAANIDEKISRIEILKKRVREDEKARIMAQSKLRELLEKLDLAEKQRDGKQKKLDILGGTERKADAELQRLNKTMILIGDLQQSLQHLHDSVKLVCNAFQNFHDQVRNIEDSIDEFDSSMRDLQDVDSSGSPFSDLGKHTIIEEAAQLRIYFAVLYDVSRRAAKIYSDIYEPALKTIGGSGHSFSPGRSGFQKQDLQKLSETLLHLTSNDSGTQNWIYLAESGALGFIEPSYQREFLSHLIRWWSQEIKETKDFLESGEARSIFIQICRSMIPPPVPKTSTSGLKIFKFRSLKGKVEASSQARMATGQEPRSDGRRSSVDSDTESFMTGRRGGFVELG